MTLGDHLDQHIAEAVRAALKVERPRLVAEILSELELAAKAPAWWTPSEVRIHARCSSAEVYNALARGELVGVADEDPARARPGISGRRWHINPLEAKSWAKRRHGGES
jgi:hypothetical protein